MAHRFSLERTYSQGQDDVLHLEVAVKEGCGVMDWRNRKVQATSWRMGSLNGKVTASVGCSCTVKASEVDCE